MSEKLWQSATSNNLHPLIEAYTVGSDKQADQQLLGYDIIATKAHVAMLQTIGILTKTELKQLTAALDDLHDLWLNGSFVVGEHDEDSHSAIEAYLVHRLDDVGKKVHAGRSRNDQALVMVRLYLKDTLEQLAALALELAASYTKAANGAGNTPMPGYTHMQKAMPTTVSTWLDSFAAGFSDMSDLISATRAIIDQNPLGSAAGFDVSLPLDRQHTTKSLGFKKLQSNPMYCGLSRGLFDLMAVQALNPIMILAGKFAQDMMLFTTQEFNFFSLPDNLTTGSSIMPHKHNYDLFEIMRGQANAFGSYTQQLQAVASGAGSGYNRDIQLTKATLLSAMETAQSTLEVLILAVPQIQLHHEVLNAAMTEEMHSVEKVNKLVEQGMPFRDAYGLVKNQLK
jgi:argininosuccinate lyase